MSFSYYGIGSYWRPFEQESANKFLGESNSKEFLLCRHNTECVSNSHIKRSIELEKKFHLNNALGKVINSVSSFDFTNNKEKCFERWRSNSINCPKFFHFKNEEEFRERNNLDYPFLIRLNDATTGKFTYLIESQKDLEANLPTLLSDYLKNKRESTTMIAVEFIDTKNSDGFNVSSRIHIAGNKVVSGYSRLSETWWAFTPAFTNRMKPSFVKEQKRLKKIVNDNNEEIVNSIKCLGLDHVGLDIITNERDEIFFLEVQPFYFCGRPLNHPNPTNPPFFNPTKPSELIEWLVSDKDLPIEMPWYYNNWLNKENHFHLCYKSISEAHNE